MDFHSGILKLSEGNFRQGIKLHIIYFSLSDINIRTVIILFSIHLPSIRTLKSWSDEPLLVFVIFSFTSLPIYFKTKLIF